MLNTPWAVEVNDPRRTLRSLPQTSPVGKLVDRVVGVEQEVEGVVVVAEAVVVDVEVVVLGEVVVGAEVVREAVELVVVLVRAEGMLVGLDWDPYCLFIDAILVESSLFI